MVGGSPLKLHWGMAEAALKSNRNRLLATILIGQNLFVSSASALATVVATRLRGKHKPIYTPHVDTGDHVVIINADKASDIEAAMKLANRSPMRA